MPLDGIHLLSGFGYFFMDEEGFVASADFAFEYGGRHPGATHSGRRARLRRSISLHLTTRYRGRFVVEELEHLIEVNPVQGLADVVMGGEESARAPGAPNRVVGDQ